MFAFAQEECFSLWLRHWAEIYEEDSPSRDVIHEAHNSLFLVAVVDDDFIRGDIFGFFEAALDLVEAHAK